MHEKRIEIRWRDMDAYAHVNNAVYLTYLEEVRDEWVQRLFADGPDPASAEETHTAIDYVIARVAIDFRRQITQSDGSIIVRCSLDHLGRSSIHTREEIRTLDGGLSAEAAAVLVVRDPRTVRARPLTDRERRTLEGDPRPEA